MSRRLACTLGLGALLGALVLPATAHAITRTKVIVSAKGYAFHPWRCTSANLVASCVPGYQSLYDPGDYMGLPYDWGGYMTTFDFDQGIADGLGAGTPVGGDPASCTVGLDCSGFVSKTWHEGYYQTSNLSLISAAINQANLLAGDIFNLAGTHVVLFSHLLGNGDPVCYESSPPNVHLFMPGWSNFDGYTPRRYQGITGTSAANPAGTAENPIVIGSFPYSDSGDTSTSESDVLDGCDADATKGEAGPEVIYQLTLTEPGQLTAAVSCGGGVDIDVELYTSMNTSDCVARHNTTISVDLDCGTYLLVANTFSSGSNEYEGAYTLNATFTPSGGSCGNGPPVYDFEGKPGDPCGNPNTPNLPFCNPNLGADTCLYTPTESACTKLCQTVADCSVFPGGCCADIGNGELYCEPAAWCGGGTGGAGGIHGGGGGQGGGATGGGGQGTGAGGLVGPGGSGATGTGAGGPGAADGSAEADAGCAVALRDGSGGRSGVGAWWLLGLAALGALRRRRDRLD